MKHTKGEWELSKFHNGVHIYCGGKKIASIWNALFSIREVEANAKLIAAAPDLLRACEIMFHGSNINLDQKVMLDTTIKNATK